MTKGRVTLRRRLRSPPEVPQMRKSDFTIEIGDGTHVHHYSTPPSVPTADTPPDSAAWTHIAIERDTRKAWTFWRVLSIVFNVNIVIFASAMVYASMFL